MNSLVARCAMFACSLALGGVAAFGASGQFPASEAARSIGGEHMWWYMGRAGGFVAYGLLFASVALGLAVSSRFFDGWLARPWVYEMHQFLSLLVLFVMLFHALVLLPDPYAKFDLEQLFIPFAAKYRPEALAAGIVTLYGSALVSASFYVKRWIGQKGWRYLHYLTFALFVAALLHGLLAGTDSREDWARYFYLVTGLAVLFLTFFRILVSRRVANAERKARAPLREASQLA